MKSNVFDLKSQNMNYMTDELQENTNYLINDDNFNEN